MLTDGETLIGIVSILSRSERQAGSFISNAAARHAAALDFAAVDEVATADAVLRH